MAILVNGKHGQGTHCTEMGADSLAENISNGLEFICPICLPKPQYKVELVSKELNHLAAILHVYAGGLILWSKKNIIFQKDKGSTFTFLIFL